MQKLAKQKLSKLYLLFFSVYKIKKCDLGYSKRRFRHICKFEFWHYLVYLWTFYPVKRCYYNLRGHFHNVRRSGWWTQTDRCAVCSSVSTHDCRRQKYSLKKYIVSKYSELPTSAAFAMFLSRFELAKCKINIQKYPRASNARAWCVGYYLKVR